MGVVGHLGRGHGDGFGAAPFAQRVVSEAGALALVDGHPATVLPLLDRCGDSDSRSVHPSSDHPKMGDMEIFFALIVRMVLP
jgi:hypothetical protein